MLEYSVCIIYLATPNEEYIIIDIFIKLMTALPATKHIFRWEWLAKNVKFFTMAENARVCFANSIPRFVKVKLKWCEIKGENRSLSCRRKWVRIN